MTLADIEKAVRPQFVWDKEQGREWYTSKKIEGDTTLGMTMFVGVSRFHGFKDQDILKYMNISRSLLLASSQRFKRNMSEFQAQESTGLEYNSACRFHNKLVMIQSYIKLHYHGREYLSLADFEF